MDVRYVCKSGSILTLCGTFQIVQGQLLCKEYYPSDVKVQVALSLISQIYMIWNLNKPSGIEQEIRHLRSLLKKSNGICLAEPWSDCPAALLASLPFTKKVQIRLVEEPNF